MSELGDTQLAAQIDAAIAILQDRSHPRLDPSKLLCPNKLTLEYEVEETIKFLKAGGLDAQKRAHWLGQALDQHRDKNHD